jgi:hypothetical protein
MHFGWRSAFLRGQRGTQLVVRQNPGVVERKGAAGVIRRDQDDAERSTLRANGLRWSMPDSPQASDLRFL